MAEPTVSDTAIFRANLGGRIAFSVDKIGKKSEAATYAGVSPEQLNKWIKGAVKVPVEALRDLAQAADVDFSWLATGHGTAPAGGPVQIRRPPSDTAEPEHMGSRVVTDVDQTGMIRLPVYSEVHASAGPGTMPTSELADGIMALDRRFLRDQGAVPEQCAVIWARGDSMMPTIPDGSALVVDRSQVDVADGCIMVLNVAGSLLVKRVQRLTSGEIRLISDNRDYEPEVLAQHQLEQLRVIGRVVYFGRTP